MADLDAVIEQYIALRDKKDAMNKAHKAKVALIDEALDAFEAFILKQMNLLNMDSVATKSGTAYKSTVTRANVRDWPGFIQFVEKHKAFDMLERRASKEAVLGYQEQHGTLPPGIDISRILNINIRRSK